MNKETDLYNLKSICSNVTKLYMVRPLQDIILCKLYTSLTTENFLVETKKISNRTILYNYKINFYLN